MYGNRRTQDNNHDTSNNTTCIPHVTVHAVQQVCSIVIGPRIHKHVRETRSYKRDKGGKEEERDREREREREKGEDSERERKEKIVRERRESGRVRETIHQRS